MRLSLVRCKGHALWGVTIFVVLGVTGNLVRFEDFSVALRRKGLGQQNLEDRQNAKTLFTQREKRALLRLSLLEDGALHLWHLE